MLQRGQGRAALVNVDQPCNELLLLLRLLEQPERRQLVRHVVLFVQLAQLDHGAIVHLHLLHAARLVVHRDLLTPRHEGDVVQLLLVLLAVRVALRALVVVVERHARADDVEHRRALVRDRGLQQRAHLLCVSCKRPCDEPAPANQRLEAEINRRQLVHARVPQLLARVRRRGELSLCEAVHAVVLDDVRDGHIAPQHMLELAEPNAPGVAIARHTDSYQRAVSERRAGRDSRHPSMQGVEAVRPAQKVRR